MSNPKTGAMLPAVEVRGMLNPGAADSETGRWDSGVNLQELKNTLHAKTLDKLAVPFGSAAREQVEGRRKLLVYAFYQENLRCLVPDYVVPEPVVIGDFQSVHDKWSERFDRVRAINAK